MDDSDVVREIKQRPTVRELRGIAVQEGPSGVADKYDIPLWKAEDLVKRYASPGGDVLDVGASPSPGQAIAQRVVVTDINMDFGSMITFMVKWAIAAIPAVIVLASIFFGVAFVLALLAGLIGMGETNGPEVYRGF